MRVDAIELRVDAIELRVDAIELRVDAIELRVITKIIRRVGTAHHIRVLLGIA
ncbi:MAG: hypothetical protein KA716_03440 [Gloeotrichia echinulata DEX184]|nr:hypothetical protein [Gloeotrichia echinulata DEX184]